MSNVIEMFTDGACKGNPGPGGWGVVLKSGEHVKELHGGEAATTNNRMELTAVIKGLSALTHRCKVKLWTDSQYVQKGITVWILDWKRRGWRTADKKPVKNVDLWQQLDAVAAQHDVRVVLGQRPRGPSWQRARRSACQPRRRRSGAPVRDCLVVLVLCCSELFVSR